jgi:branched-chain amino acid transport system permease protein
MAGSKMDIKTTVGSDRRSAWKWALYAAIAFVLVIMPLVFTGYGQLFAVRIMAVIGIYVMLALGLNIVVGYAGLLDLGYIAFYAMGAYAGVLVGDIFTKVTHLPGLAYWAMIPVAAAVAALTGLALGTPVLRLRGDYLAIVTLGFGEIVRIILNNLAVVTNGAAGLPKAGQVMPSPWPLDWLKDNVHFTIPAINFDFSFTNNLFWYIVIVLLCMLTIFVVTRLDNSRLGRSWVAMREDEVAANSVGINTTVAKLWAFSLGALWGGIAGVTFANFQAFVSPESFTFIESVFVVVSVVIGGMGSIPGVIVGAILIQGIPETIRGLASSGVVNLTGEQIALISNYRFLVFGLLLVVMMAWRPQGFIPSKRRAQELKPESADIRAQESENEYEIEQNHDGAGPPGL